MYALVLHNLTCQHLPTTLVSLTDKISTLVQLSQLPVTYHYSVGFSWNTPSDDNSTISYAFVLHDPDATPVVGFPFLHWGVLNIPASVLSLYEGQSTKKDMPSGSFEVFNPMTKTTGYFGLCPPAGRHHIYRALVFARDQMENPKTFKFKEASNAEELISFLMMDGHTLAVSEIGGVFP